MKKNIFFHEKKYFFHENNLKNKTKAVRKSC